MPLNLELKSHHIIQRKVFIGTLSYPNIEHILLSIVEAKRRKEGDEKGIHQV
jgi:hypothetical protein